MRTIDADELIHRIGLIPLEYEHRPAVKLFYGMIEEMPTLTPQNEPLTIEQLREMKDEPAYLKVFDPLLQSEWHIIKAVTEDKIIFRGWQTVYVPIDGMGTDYNLYRRPPERQEAGQ